MPTSVGVGVGPSFSRTGAAAALPISVNYTYLAPGGTRYTGTMGATKAFRIPLKIPLTRTFTGIRVWAVDTGQSYVVRRCYIASDPNATTITEDFSTGLKTVVGAGTQTIPGTGSVTDNKLVALGSGIIAASGGPNATVVIEVDSAATYRLWGNPLSTVGIDPVYTGAEHLLGLNTLPSSGTISYASTYPPNGQYPNIIVEFVGLNSNVVNVAIIGDSQIEPYGDGGGINDKQGLASRWMTSWTTDSKPYIPLQLGWMGQSTAQILSRAQGFLRDLDIRCAVYEAMSINNWDFPKFGFPDPSAQGIADLASAKAAFGTRPFWPILAGVWDVLTAPERAAMRAGWDTIKSTYASTIIPGVETSGAIDAVNMTWTPASTFDGGHFNTTGYNQWATATYAQLNAKITAAGG